MFFFAGGQGWSENPTPLLASPTWKCSSSSWQTMWQVTGDRWQVIISRALKLSSPAAAADRNLNLNAMTVLGHTSMSNYFPIQVLDDHGSFYCSSNSCTSSRIHRCGAGSGYSLSSGEEKCEQFPAEPLLDQSSMEFRCTTLLSSCRF